MSELTQCVMPPSTQATCANLARLYVTEPTDDHLRRLVHGLSAKLVEHRDWIRSNIDQAGTAIHRTLTRAVAVGGLLATEPRAALFGLVLAWEGELRMEAEFGPTENQSGRTNSKANAIKHCFWNATMTIMFGAELALRVSDAWEAGNPNDYSKRQDLFNNRGGATIGLEMLAASQGSRISFPSIWARCKAAAVIGGPLRWKAGQGDPDTNQLGSDDTPSNPGGGGDNGGGVASNRTDPDLRPDRSHPDNSEHNPGRRVIESLERSRDQGDDED